MDRIVSDGRIHCTSFEFFLKIPVLMTDQSDESRDCYRLRARRGENETGENIPDNVHMQTDSRGWLKCLWRVLNFFK